MAKLIQTRPLAGLSNTLTPDGEGAPPQLILQEIPARGIVNLRLNPAKEAEAVTALREVLHLELPMQPNRVTHHENHRCLWLGPDEWLVMDEAKMGSVLAQDLAKILAAYHHSAHDLSHNYATIGLSGHKVREALAKLTPFDLHKSVFTQGHCAQTVMAKSAVILDVISDEGAAVCFEITLRRSFAAYVWARIKDAGAEFALAVRDFD